MNRRSFLKESLLACGAMAAVPIVAEAGSRSKKNNSQPQISEDFVMEPARRLQVLLSADVVVVGGGPAGVTAALSAARNGAKTVVLERYNHLGGLWTGGLVLPTNCTHGLSPEGKQVQVMHGIAWEIHERLKKDKMIIRDVDPFIDPEAAKFLLDEMMKEAGVEVVYHCYASQAVMDGHHIRGIIIESKSGRQVVMGKQFIDCTGDGDVFAWAGESYDTRRHAIGMEARIVGADRIDKNAPGYKDMKLNHKTPIPGVNWLCHWGVKDQDGLDVRNLSRAQQEVRKMVWERYQTIRATPGHEQVYLVDTASQLGVRCTRVLQAKYRLTLEDSMTYRSFSDCIGVSGAWTKIPYKGRVVPRKERPYWQIPYSALLPRKTDNLLVAGRCFSFDEGLVEDAREVGTCLITGQAVGTAAAQALAQRTSVQDIDTARLVATLKQQGVWMP